jgi:hypothetical protein
MALLDMAEAADVFGQRGDLHRKGVIGRGERGGEFVDRLTVLRDELALAPALGAAAEYDRTACRASLEAVPAA